MTAFREAFPILYVDDVPRAIAFYESALGFETAYRWPAEGDATFAFLRLDPLGIAASARASATDPQRDFELCIYTDDADSAAERLTENGAGQLWAQQLLHIAQPT